MTGATAGCELTTTTFWREGKENGRKQARGKKTEMKRERKKGVGGEWRE